MTNSPAIENVTAEKRRAAADRQKRRRDRLRRGVRLVSLEVDQGQIADALVAVGVLEAWDCEDPDKVRTALREALSRLHVTRDV